MNSITKELIWPKLYSNDFRAFVQEIISWEPDYIVPVARKCCKLFRIASKPIASKSKIIFYLKHFEFFDIPLEGKRVAVVDDATQYAATLYEHRHFFEKRGATVQTFAFTGHCDAKNGLRSLHDSRVRIRHFLTEATYNEYVLQQGEYLVNEAANQDIDHLVVELYIQDVEKFLVEDMKNILSKWGYVYHLDPLCLLKNKRFAIDHPTFFDIRAVIPAQEVAPDFVSKIRFIFRPSEQQLLCVPMVFPRMKGGSQQVCVCPANIPFQPFCQRDGQRGREHAVDELCYLTVCLHLSVVLARGFVLAMRESDSLLSKKLQNLKVRSGDLCRYLGNKTGQKVACDIQSFLTATTNEIDASIRQSRGQKQLAGTSRISFTRHGVAKILDTLKSGYERKCAQEGTRVGIHYPLTVDELLKISGGMNPLEFSEILDEQCDEGFLVPCTTLVKGEWRRTYRTGEPIDATWYRTTYLVPMAIMSYTAERHRTPRVGAMELMKLLANFIYDFPCHGFTELHCLLPEPQHWGTMVYAQHRVRAPDKVYLYDESNLGGRYHLVKEKHGRRRLYFETSSDLLEGFEKYFDDSNRVSVNLIKDYFRFFAKLAEKSTSVDVLNAFSLCRAPNWFYLHVYYNMRSWLTSYGNFLDRFIHIPYSEGRSGPLLMSRLESVSGLDKIDYLNHFPSWLQDAKDVAQGDPLSFQQLSDSIHATVVPYPWENEDVIERASQFLRAQSVLTSLGFMKSQQAHAGSRAESELFEKGPSSLQRMGVSFDFDTFADPRIEPRRAKEMLLTAYERIRQLFTELPVPKDEIRESKQAYYQDQAKCRLVLLAQQRRWGSITILCSDLSEFSVAQDPEKRCGTFYETLDVACKEYEGEPVNPHARGDDCLFYAFGSPVAAVWACDRFKRARAEQPLLKVNGVECIPAKVGMCYVDLPESPDPSVIVTTMGLAKDCCELKRPSFRNRDDVLVPESFVTVLRNRGEESIANRFVALNEDCVVARRGVTQRVYKLTGYDEIPRGSGRL